MARSRTKGQRRNARASVAMRGATPAPLAPERADASAPDEPEALVLSYVFDPGAGGDPYTATLRLVGRRASVSGRPQPRDTFLHTETIEQILPGSGPISITSWVYGVPAGDWSVSGDLVRDPPAAEPSGPHGRTVRATAQALQPASWSWRRRAVAAGSPTLSQTRWAILAPLARRPAVVPGVWTVLAAFGIAIGLTTQTMLLAADRLPLDRALLASVLAIAAGLLGAKLWYAVLHPGPLRQWIQGWAVDGFLAIGPVAALVALLALRVPIGGFFDASAPGLFLGVAIARIGCFFAGCCAGRCTTSRWGVWSSDGRVGARRIPTPLIESAVGLLLAVAGLALAAAGAAGGGLIFVASFATYLIARQVLLRLRAERRTFSWRRSGVVSSARS